MSLRSVRARHGNVSLPHQVGESRVAAFTGDGEMAKGMTAKRAMVEAQAPRMQSGIQMRSAALAGEWPGVEDEADQEHDLGLSVVLDAYDAGGYGVSVGAACALGTQLCDVLHRLHHGSEARGELRVHGRVAFDTVRVSLAGELTLTGLDAAQPDPRGRAVDVRDAAVLVTELLGGQAAALKLLPSELARVVERALVGARPGDRPVRAADLARALATEAASPGELHTELRLLWPRPSTAPRLPLPPRLPSGVPATPACLPGWEPAPRASSAPRTIPARPSATHREAG